MNDMRTYKGFPIYMRGFLGSPHGKMRDTNRSLVYDTTLADNMYRKAMELANQNAYNPNAVNIYVELLKNPLVVHDDMFLRATIKTAKEAFGTTSFVDWFQLQYQSPDTGSTHIDYLEDMLEFALVGRAYKPLYDNQTWLSVLNLTLVRGNETYLSKQTEEMLERFVKSHGRSVDDFINAMLLKEFGHEQLVRTLFVLFGDMSATNHA